MSALKLASLNAQAPSQEPHPCSDDANGRGGAKTTAAPVPDDPQSLLLTVRQLSRLLSMSRNIDLASGGRRPFAAADLHFAKSGPDGVAVRLNGLSQRSRRAVDQRRLNDGIGNGMNEKTPTTRSKE